MITASRVVDNDKEWRAFQKTMRGIGDAVCTVGLHSDAEPYERGQEAPATVAQVASFHEFGTEKMPARPFMRPTVDGNRAQYGALIDRMAKLVIDRKLAARKALGILGEKVSVDIKQAITDVTTPELAASTIASKKAKAGYLGAAKAQAYVGSGANPLIDTGHMRQSVTYKVTVDGVTEGPPTVKGGES